jgi:hypothetical protein
MLLSPFGNLSHTSILYYLSYYKSRKYLKSGDKWLAKTKIKSQSSKQERRTVFIKYLLIICYCGMSTKTELTDTAYDILKVLGKEADFLYDTIETYIKDAQKANKTEMVKIWQTIKEDRKRHMHLLKEALEKEIHS